VLIASFHNLLNCWILDITSTNTVFPRHRKFDSLYALHGSRTMAQICYVLAFVAELALLLERTSPLKSKVCHPIHFLQVVYYRAACTRSSHHPITNSFNL